MTASLLMTSCDEKKPEAPSFLPLRHQFVLDERTKQLASVKQQRDVLELAQTLTLAVLNNEPSILAELLTDYVCVDDLVSRERQRKILLDPTQISHAFVFDANWKKRFLTYDGQGFQIKRPDGSLSSGLKSVEPMGFAEILGRLQGQIRILFREYREGDWHSLHAEILYYDEHPANRTYFELLFDQEQKRWKLTGTCWECTQF